MPSDNDKYPSQTGRRRFVKGVVGASALGAAGVTGAAATNAATSPTGEGGGTTQYYGIENTDGPAPRGMPQIPVEIDDDGTIRGVWPDVEERTTETGQTLTVAETQIEGQTYSSEWFQYCGLQGYTGVQPEVDQDTAFRSSSAPPYEWQSELEEGEPFTVDMFEDYESWGNGIGKSGLGKPAMGTWRSDGVSPQNTLTIQVLRSTRIEQEAENDPWLNATTEQGFIAWMDKCTHFCCVPGFKSTEQSARFGAQNDVYCPCHQSIYDPFSVVQNQFVALPRPEDAGGGGSSSGESGGGSSGGGSSSGGE